MTTRKIRREDATSGLHAWERQTHMPSWSCRHCGLFIVQRKRPDKKGCMSGVPPEHQAAIANLVEHMREIERDLLAEDDPSCARRAR